MSSSSRDLIVHIQCKLLATSYNVRTRQCVSCVDLSNLETAAQIFTRLCSTFNIKQVKAISFFFGSPEFPTLKKQYEFLHECREFCRKNGIFYFSPSLIHFESSLAFSQSKTMVKEGEKVMVFFVDSPKMLSYGCTFVRKKECFEIDMNVSSNHPPLIKLSEENVIETVKPKKVILIQGIGPSKDIVKAKLIFKNYNPPIISVMDIADNHLDTIADIVLHLMGEQVNPYHIAIQCWFTLEVRCDGKSLVKVREYDILPYEKSIVIPVKSTKCVSLYCNNNYFNVPEILEEIKFSAFKCKKVTVTLKVDMNAFYELKVEPFENGEKLDEKMSKMNISDKAVDEKQESKEAVVAVDECTASSIYNKSIMPEKARMIFDKQNFCVSYFADGREYNLNDSEGMNKTPIYISFADKKPVIGKAAEVMYNEKPKSVVFDLIKLCSITNTDVENPKWGFTVSKEDDDSIMVIWETPDGKQKQTVEFLLALIIKNGKDRIKKAYGKRMTDMKIGFDGFVPNEMLKKNFIDAGKLLKIDIIFV